MNIISRPSKHLIDFDEFCRLVPNGKKANLIDGVIYMASRDNTDAGELFVWLIALIELFVRQRSLGKVYGSRVAFRLDEWSSPEPDIAFVSNRRLKLVQPGFVRGGPDLALEIVSPESVERDYEQKWEKYERAKVREYWIIDEIERKITLYRLDRSGKYREVAPKRGKFVSTVLRGFWLEPAWLWQSPRPLQTTILARFKRR
jgi:Uma2 family endonuclease